MNAKKIGIWTGGFIGSFIVLTVIAYFLFPYINPEKAAEIEKEQPSMKKASFDPGEFNLQAVDSLNQELSNLHMKVDSLRRENDGKQQLIDSLQTGPAMDSPVESEPAEMTAAEMTEAVPAIEEASKPLLGMDEDDLAPIVDLLDENQLISLYREGSGRQRQKLLRVLKPQKAAKILKKVM
jgi:cell division protein FtsB